jgi:hypothetical protein
VRERFLRVAVFLFITEPIRQKGAVVGVVYAVRSTRPGGQDRPGRSRKYNPSRALLPSRRRRKSQLNEPPNLAHVVLAAHLRPRDVARAKGLCPSRCRSRKIEAGTPRPRERWRQSAADQGGRLVVTVGNHEAELLVEPTNRKASAFDDELTADHVMPAGIADGSREGGQDVVEALLADGSVKGL